MDDKDLDSLLEPKKLVKELVDAKALLPAVEQELDSFDAFFSAPIAQGGAGNEPLVRSERAILRTYLIARLTERFPSILEL